MASQSSATLYQGHSIFRNQPPYTHFNKSFEDPTDALFLGLNEIDPFWLQEEQLRDNSGFEFTVLTDPRTQQEVPEVLYDHTLKTKPKIFLGGGVKSSMTKAQHVVCVRVLKAWQEQQEVSEEDLLQWRKADRQRVKEKQQMLKFIYDYAQTHKETMYAPANKLVNLYKKWFSRRVERLLLKYAEDVAFNTHTGLPHVRVCKSESGKLVELTGVELLARRGTVRVCSDDTRFDCQHMHHRLDTFAGIYSDALLEEHELLKADIELQLNAAELAEECHRFLLPLDSILLLLTAGEYIDLPTEVMLQITQDARQDVKLVVFEEPLPSRNCGWHTHKHVVEQAYAAYLSTKEDVKWLSLENDKVTQVQLKGAEEILAYDNEPKSFEPLDFDEYLQRYQSKYKQGASNMKHNAALMKWHLKVCESEESPLEIYTTLQFAAALNEKATKFVGSHAIKLEYKPQFGCEVMTKYELLREWLRLSLLSACTVIGDGKCLRIATSTFETQLDEPLSLPRIEQQLTDVYHVNMPHLLANLTDFLKLLLKMPVGKYLLRYNPKFRDKMMLCAPTQEITQNTVFLHSLLKVEPTDLLFMTQPNFLPIADNLCSSVHLFHKVLPCSFLPLLPHQKRQQLRKNPAVFNDREYVLKRVQRKMDIKNAKLKAIENKRKACQKTRRRKRLRLDKAQEKQAQQDEQELQKEIEIDNAFYGF